ncbi:MAG: sulfite exporter TauE/SafE family protein [bacterium]|nr:sulfite exporter TauE/SafE family protein [bacterium]
MEASGELTAFLLLGLIGSLHCVGMCGGFTLSVVASAGGSRKRALWRVLLYVLGKALTYSILGLAVANAVHWVTDGGAASQESEGSGFALVRSLLAWCAGGVMILTGLWSLGFLAPISRRTGQPGVVARAFVTLGTSVRALGGSAGAFGTGVLTGLLPCGLSWAAFAFATQVSRPTAAAGLLLFGLGTGAAPVLLGLGWASLQLRWRTLAVRLTGCALVVFGALTILRGGPLVPTEGTASEQESPDCCDDVLEQARELDIDLIGREPK